MESILNSIKKFLGIGEDQKHFDPDIIMHINSVFSTLSRLGVGPSEGFYIEDDLSSWSDFIPDESILRKLHLIKTYMELKVKLLFDPPLNSAVITAMKEEIKEHEWRITEIAESISLSTEEHKNG